MMLPAGAEEGKLPYPRMASHYPLRNVMGDGIFGLNTLYNNVKFLNFSSNITFCGTNHSLFASN
jgi:hypothetical protein